MQVTRLLRSYHGQRPSITGFNIETFKKAAGPPRYDPWARREAWRYEGRFSRLNRFRGSLPGLGTASVAFAVYCAYEHFFIDEQHQHHDEGDGAKQHGDGH